MREATGSCLEMELGKGGLTGDWSSISTSDFPLVDWSIGFAGQCQTMESGASGDEGAGATRAQGTEGSGANHAGLNVTLAYFVLGGDV